MEIKRQRKLKVRIISTAAAVVVAVTTAGLAIAAQRGWPWRFGKVPPTDAETEMASLAVEEESQSLIQAVHAAESASAEVGELSPSEPISPAKVADSSGPRQTPLGQATDMHTGVDYYVNAGDAIHAAADGAVIKAAALAQGEWTLVGPLRQRKESASYKVQSFERMLYGRPYRFIVVHSTHLEQRKQHSVQRQAERERKDVEMAAEVLGKTMFNCRSDAEREAPIQITTYRVQAELGELQSDLLQARRDEESLFILVTNLLDAHTHPPEAVLREYKEQASAEVRFRFLKDPAFVDGFFVKDKGRLEALAYLMLVALLVYALIERLVRMGLREQKRSFIGVGGVKHEEPTGRVILAILATLHVLGGQPRGNPTLSVGMP